MLCDIVGIGPVRRLGKEPGQGLEFAKAIHASDIQSFAAFCGSTLSAAPVQDNENGTGTGTRFFSSYQLSNPAIAIQLSSADRRVGGLIVTDRRAGQISSWRSHSPCYLKAERFMTRPTLSFQGIQSRDNGSPNGSYRLSQESFLMQ